MKILIVIVKAVVEQGNMTANHHNNNVILWDWGIGVGDEGGEGVEIF